MFRLDGKTALVTGGTRGLGWAIARLFGSVGANVMIASENSADCEAAQLRARADGLEISARRCNVRDIDEQRALVAATLERFGRLDILVANAGITGPLIATPNASAEELDLVLSTNLTSVVRLCDPSLPSMRAAGGGSIVLMSSIAGIRGNRALGAYALSKAALAQLARNLAVECGPDNIRANAIAPGFIKTDLATRLLEDPTFMARRMAMTPLRRPGEPEEIASAALYLASRAGAFVTGHTLVVDGGTTITDGN